MVQCLQIQFMNYEISYFVSSLLLLFSYIKSQPQFPLLPTSTRSTPTNTDLCSERRVLPGTSTKHGVSSFDKTRHITSFQGWMGQPSQEKSRQESEPSPFPLLGFLQEPKLLINNISAENLGQIPTGFLISTSLRRFGQWIVWAIISLTQS